MSRLWLSERNAEYDRPLLANCRTQKVINNRNKLVEIRIRLNTVNLLAAGRRPAYVGKGPLRERPDTGQNVSQLSCRSLAFIFL